MLVVSDPQRLMENSFGTSGNFKFFKGVARLEHIATQLSRVMKVPITGARYDAQILDAGVWFMRQCDVKEWTWLLMMFSCMPYLADLDPTSHEFRRLDQRFLTAYGCRKGWDRLFRAPDRRNCYSHPTKFNIPTLVKDTVFVHYKTGRHKRDWMTALETFLLERS